MANGGSVSAQRPGGTTKLTVVDAQTPAGAADPVGDLVQHRAGPGGQRDVRRHGRRPHGHHHPARRSDRDRGGHRQGHRRQRRQQDRPDHRQGRRRPPPTPSPAPPARTCCSASAAPTPCRAGRHRPDRRRRRQRHPDRRPRRRRLPRRSRHRHRHGLPPPRRATPRPRSPNPPRRVGRDQHPPGRPAHRRLQRDDHQLRGRRPPPWPRLVPARHGADPRSARDPPLYRQSLGKAGLVDAIRAAPGTARAGPGLEHPGSSGPGPVGAPTAACSPSTAYTRRHAPTPSSPRRSSG